MAGSWEAVRLMGVALGPSPRWGFGMTRGGGVGDGLSRRV